MVVSMASDQKLVVRFKDGRILKGTSQDFSPNKNHFHLTLLNRPSTNPPVEIFLEDVKGVFFVKDFIGKKDYHPENSASSPGKTFYGERTIVHFKDGETVYGFTQEYTPGRLGFFLYPYDSQSNNIKLFAIHTFVARVEFPPPQNPGSLES